MLPLALGCSKNRKKKIFIYCLLNYTDRTGAEIAKDLGMSKNALYHLMRRFEMIIENIEEYRILRQSTMPGT